MAGATELPELIREFTDMSKEYLRQETLEPARQLGRYAGFSIAAGFCFALAALLLGIATMRALVGVLPDGVHWEALGYVLGALAMALGAALVIGLTSSGSSNGE